MVIQSEQFPPCHWSKSICLDVFCFQACIHIPSFPKYITSGLLLSTSFSHLLSWNWILHPLIMHANKKTSFTNKLKFKRIYLQDFCYTNWDRSCGMHTFKTKTLDLVHACWVTNNARSVNIVFGAHVNV